MGSVARAAVHNLWGEESALGPQKWESSKADSADTKMSYGVYAVSPDCSRQLRKIVLLPFLMHYVGLLMQIYILVNIYLLVIFHLNFIGQCEMYF